MTVIEEISAERKRQIEEEGWTPEHDDEHDRGELAAAAACYALHSCGFIDLENRKDSPPPYWPWENVWWKPKGPRRDLIRAAALFVAEIERMDRGQAND